ncbi:flagellin lysine-N-methylase [Vibrio mangrovi]|uniref:Flagellar biosynthetic protein FliU n=1 Tax=Vibrio mangrovi TaxID=474394 RepID=A0A1Y6ISR7_9VIBR|nr:flagellin lysine-N-methylase [Vibrio mangrovi]MDW6004079.1 flagellin lysine-N-methylase [Vibrio mangrovi]SMR99123.1 Flagellar biosynthetic protein FliU [Vibrio mangrovi]
MYQSSTLGFSYIEQFRCLADQCENNCCHEWNITIHEDQVQHYRNNFPPLYDLIVREDDIYRLRRDETGNTCAAQDQGMCTVHRDYGESQLSDTCIDYPRLYRSLNQFYSRAGTMSCPDIARRCLFDENPFELIPTQLPENHQHGKGLFPAQIEQLTQDIWARTISALITTVQDKDLSIEATLAMLLTLAPKLESTPRIEWQTLIEDAGNHVGSTGESGDVISVEEQGNRTTDFLLVVLEHLERKSMPESLRQGMLGVFEVLSRNEQQRPRCRLLQSVKDYYQEHRDSWIKHVLKRFVAAEISRNGFPFISTTPAGKDYGTTLEEWAATLCLRTLSLRLFLTTSAVHIATPEQPVPDEDTIVGWVYRFCRRINHDTTGPLELRMRQMIMESESTRLREYLDFSRL